MGLLLLTNHKEYKEPIFILNRQNSTAQHMTLVCTQNNKWLRDYILTQEHALTLIIVVIIIIIIIIIIFINCNWVVTRWQWLFYMYTNMKKSN